MNKSTITDEEFIKITTNCPTMAQASILCGMSYSNFIRKAKKLNVYKPNQGGKGTKKPKTNKIKTEDILAGKYPSYQTYKLKRRLIDEGYLKDECQRCGWKEKPEGNLYTPCELDHIDGNSTNHKFENLILLCPNCHSLTKTYRFRRGKTNESQGRKLLDDIDAKSRTHNDG